jgi:uncharacterized OB-fold protein
LLLNLSSDQEKHLKIVSKEMPQGGAMSHKRIPVEAGLFDVPESMDQPIYLNGSFCNACSRYFFPKVERCYRCGSADNITDARLGRKGKLYTYTNCCYPPPGGRYRGKLPFGLGLVALDEGIIICTRVNETDTSRLRVGLEVEAMLETLYINDKGDEIVCFTYNPLNDDRRQNR